MLKIEFPFARIQWMLELFWEETVYYVKRGVMSPRLMPVQLIRTVIQQFSFLPLCMITHGFLHLGV